MQCVSIAKTTKKLTRKGQREHDAAEARVLRHGPRYTQMLVAAKAHLAEKCRSLTKKNVLEFVREQSVRLKIRVDRDATRRFTCAICWLCENMPQLIPQAPIDDDMFRDLDWGVDGEDLDWTIGTF
jgi:hypothetical protein